MLENSSASGRKVLMLNIYSLTRTSSMVSVTLSISLGYLGYVFAFNGSDEFLQQVVHHLMLCKIGCVFYIMHFLDLHFKL
jgi:uncharacterized protein YacL